MLWLEKKLFFSTLHQATRWSKRSNFEYLPAYPIHSLASNCATLVWILRAVGLPWQWFYFYFALKISSNASKLTMMKNPSSLNFNQAKKLIRDLKPSMIATPEAFTVPPISAPQRKDLVLDVVSPIMPLLQKAVASSRWEYSKLLNFALNEAAVINASTLYKAHFKVLEYIFPPWGNDDGGPPRN